MKKMPQLGWVYLWAYSSSIGLGQSNFEESRFLKKKIKILHRIYKQWEQKKIEIGRMKDWKHKNWEHLLRKNLKITCTY